MGRGHHIGVETEECVLRLAKFFKSEKDFGRHLVSDNSIERRVSVALGVGEKTVRRILSGKCVRRGKRLTNKTRTRKRKLDSFESASLRRLVHRLYKENKFIGTRKLKVDLLNETGVDVSSSTVYRTLKRLGFRYYNKTGKRFLRERADVVSARHQYLRRIKEFREAGHQIVYLDETWLNVNHAAQGEWTENDHRSCTNSIQPNCRDCGRFIPSGKGKRLIILDAGGENGFVPGVGLVFLSNTKSEDYHDEMNIKTFMEWFTDVLLPSLEEPSVIVLDNAPYHNGTTQESKSPTTKNRKGEIVEWLQQKDIAFLPTQTKAELLDIVRLHKPTPVYLTDVAAFGQGHLCLRLPVRHCELNPIELIQAQEKQYVGQNNCSFKLPDIKRLFFEAKDNVTVDHWKSACRHTKDVEQQFWLIDNLHEEEVAPVSICLDESSDEEDADSDTDDEAEHCPNAGGDASSSIREDDDGLCGVCHSLSPQSGHDEVIQWVFCDGCDQWLHLVCSGELAIPEAENYLCKRCIHILHSR